MPNGTPIWSRLSKALDALSEESWQHGGVEQTTVGDLLQKVFPKAQTKHLRMFEAWCSQYDALSDSRAACCELEQGAAVYANNELKPLLPVEDREVLGREFDRLDCSHNGYILPMDIVRGWKWTEEQAKETVAAYDIHGLGRIDKTGFIKMMCPVEFRSPEMNGFGRELFGEFVVFHAAEMRLDLNTRESQYSAAFGDQPLLGTLFVPPTTALPAVSEAAWAQWNAVFDSLDKDGDDQIVTKDLLEAGLLSEPVCHSVIRLIDPEVEGSFTRGGFLQALLRAHRCQHPQKHTTPLQEAK
jgi:Ca2+-binding EF-hand superfamily protein